MKIILLEDVAKLGNAGDVVNVSAGFGRNYLLPKKLAVLANHKSINNLAKIKQAAIEKSVKAQNVMKAIALELSGTELQFTRKADENGHLYGSVSDTDVAVALKNIGFDVHKNMIDGEKHIKKIGIYDLRVQFNADIIADIKVNVQVEQ